MKFPMIALTGYGYSGKDTLGDALIAAGYLRVAPGDAIKDLFDEQCRRILGFSAHTSDPEQKERIRPLLVHGGQTFYDYIFGRFFAEIDALMAQNAAVVNTRLFRPEEAREWVARGGVIWEVHRIGNPPKEPEEEKALEEIQQAGLISRVVVNGSTIDDHRRSCRAIAEEMTCST